MNALDWVFIAAAAISASYGLLGMYVDGLKCARGVLGFSTFVWATIAIIDLFRLTGKCPTP